MACKSKNPLAGGSSRGMSNNAADTSEFSAPGSVSKQIDNINTAINDLRAADTGLSQHHTYLLETANYKIIINVKTQGGV